MRTSITPRLLAAALALPIAVAACTDTPPPAAPSASAEVAGAALASVAAVAASDAPDPLALANAVPGFAGYYIDEAGAPTVWLTDPSQRDAAAQALAGFLESYGWTAADLRVREAAYDWKQLHAWHEASWPQALAVAGALTSDIDERNNRLRFTGIDASALSGILAAVTGAGVPSAAVEVALRGPVFQVASLRDRIRPAHGGLQLQFFASPISPVLYNCTLGFNVLAGGVQSFVTNSHCSNVQGGETPRTDYYQSVRGGVQADNLSYIASEVDDPDYVIGGAGCPAARQCRYSDASRAQYAAGQTFAIGRIARTALLNTIRAQDSVRFLAIDSLAPQWRITAEQGNTVLGQTLNKTGRTTGWTQGTVEETCVNVSVTDSPITQLCQTIVGAHVAGGDSGSPVFGLHTDGTVFLAGILWGSSTNLTTGLVRFIMSPLSAIERELGALTTEDPATTSEPTKPGKGPRKQR